MHFRYFRHKKNGYLEDYRVRLQCKTVTSFNRATSCPVSTSAASPCSSQELFSQVRSLRGWRASEERAVLEDGTATVYAEAAAPVTEIGTKVDAATYALAEVDALPCV